MRWRHASRFGSIFQELYAREFPEYETSLAGIYGIVGMSVHYSTHSKTVGQDSAMGTFLSTDPLR